MPHEVKLEQLPAGYAAESAHGAGDVAVWMRGFVSSDQGADFLKLIEGFPSEILQKLSDDRPVRPSTVDHMLVIIRRDKTSTAYVNELQLVLEVQVKRSLKAGEPVFFGDIADVKRLKLGDVAVPADAAIVFVFSQGWRKGYFFDFEPLRGADRSYDLERQCAQCLAYVAFQHLFSLSDQDWARLIEQGWFPFIELGEQKLRDVIACSREGWVIDELHLAEIAEDVKKGLPAKLKSWDQHPIFKGHMTLIRRAAERYQDGDNVSACAILYPRIEGIIRSRQKAMAGAVDGKQKALVEVVLDANRAQRHAYSLLLPDRFRQYLQDVYFAHFDPGNPKGLSRHTVSHGVAPEKQFSVKGATIGFLLLTQLSYYLSN